MNKKYNQSLPISVLMIGPDLTSHGGIASVVKSYYKVYEEKELPLTISLLKTGYYKDKNLLFEIVILLQSLLKFKFHLIFSHYKIIHVHSSGGIGFFRASLFVVLGKIFLKKVVIHLHASNFYNFFLNKNKLIKNYISFIFKKVDSVIVLCKDWEKKLKTIYNIERIFVLSNPISLEINSFEILKDKNQDSVFNVLFLGFLIESKGILDIIEIAKKIKKDDVRNIKILIAGKGELEKRLLKEIKENQLKDLIEFLGWVNSKEKLELLSIADIFFLPSYKEGLPISILEAMAVGLPIVSTKISGIPDAVIEDYNGYLFNPGDLDGFYNVILTLSANREKVSILGENSLHKVREFNSDLIFKKLFNFYQEILN